jgi:hypothetical protein
LYRLKKTLREWYSRIDGYLQIMGFNESESYQNLYFLFVEVDFLIFMLYVDDLFLTGLRKLIVGCKKHMVVELKMKDIGLMHKFLGLEVWWRPTSRDPKDILNGVLQIDDHTYDQ